MSENRDFEREVAAWVVAQRDSAPPARALDQILTATSRQRPMPRWLALIKEPPMRLSSRVTVGSPTARLAALLAAAILISVLGAGAVVTGASYLAGAGPLIVDPSDPSAFQTITAAVDKAEDGDTILVRPGTYRESITISEDISLQGEGGPGEVVVESDDTSPTFDALCEFSGPYGLLLEDSEAEVSGLTLRDRTGTVHLVVVDGGAPFIHDIIAEQPELPNPIGISACFDRGSAGTIRDSTLDIVFVTQGSPATIERNTITGWTIINPSGARGSADSPTIVKDNHVQGVTFNGAARVEGNVFELEPGEVDESASDPDDEWFWGVNIHGGSGWSVSDNTFDGFAIGIDVAVGAGAGTISGNTISDTGTGIRLFAGPLVERNTIRGGSDGIRTDSIAAPTITENSVEGAERGVAIEGASRPILSGNVLCGNTTNLFVGVDAEPVLETNEICEDGLAAR
jgi:hypothetical protein